MESLTPATNRELVVVPTPRPSPRSADRDSTDLVSALAAIDASLSPATDDVLPGASASAVVEERRPLTIGDTSLDTLPETDGSTRLAPARPSDRRTTSGSSLPPEAEFRSRLSWFLAVADQSATDPGALTYETGFGLREKPFSLSSDPRFFFTRSAHGTAFNTLASGIRRREGILVLTGEVGTGKTTLCRSVLQSLDQKTFAAYVADPFQSREDLLKTLLVDFGVVSVDEIRRGLLRGASRVDLCYPLYEFLGSLQPLKAFAVVMIDEAQNLTPELLEEVRILSDLEKNRQKLLEVFLIGQPELETRLAAPNLRQLTQRVTIRCELPALTREEVGAYIAHRLDVAGNDGRVRFTENATELVFAGSEGVPRVVNLICDRALMRAARFDTTRVDPDHVVWGIKELKLPVPSNPMMALVHSQPEPKTAREMAAVAEVLPPAAPIADEPQAPASLVETVADLMVEAPLPQIVQAVAEEPPIVHAASVESPIVQAEVVPSIVQAVEIEAPAEDNVPNEAIEPPVVVSDAIEALQSENYPAVAIDVYPEETATVAPVFEERPKVALSVRELGLADLESELSPPTSMFEEVEAPALPNRTTWMALAAAGLILVVGFAMYRFWPSAHPEPSTAAVAQPAAQSGEPPAPPAAAAEPAVTSTLPRTSIYDPAPPPTTPPLAPAPAATAGTDPIQSASAQRGEQYAILMATFQSEERSVKSVKEFTEAGFGAFSVEMPVGNGRGHAVFLGPYPDATSASRDLERSKQIRGYEGGRIVKGPR